FSPLAGSSSPPPPFPYTTLFRSLLVERRLLWPATSPRTNKIKTTTRLVRFRIQLKFIYSICQTLYSWPERGITTGLSDGGEPQAGSTCALTGLQHIARAALLRVFR